MNNNYNTEDDYAREAEARRKRREKRRRRERIFKIVSILMILLFLAGGALLVSHFVFHKDLWEYITPSFTSGTAENQTGMIEAPETEALTETAEAPAQNAADDGTVPTAENTSAADPSRSGADDPVNDSSSDLPAPETEAAAENTAASGDTASVLAQADRMAMGYDYDGAIALLKTLPGYESLTDVTAAISSYEETKASCVPVDVNTVPHIFYHSLINDTASAFDVAALGQFAVDGMNAWMTTIDEFDQITQQMYDNGYVFVRLRDLVIQTTDENGNVHFEPNDQLLLPPGKKAVVLSIDDLSYYHSYAAASYPDKLVLDENGQVKCHYVKPDGTEEIGDFDVVPRLNAFLEEHPDGSYKGARGLIALTGYNGVFGYRTDIDYKVKEKLMADQEAWLNDHPDFNWEEDVAQATIIADAIKASGWEFASHTWGHLSVTNKTAQQLQEDNEKWVNTVQNIVGPVDTIIFAHGNDIGDWQNYSSDNEKYSYFKSAGYNFFCNVDSSVPYWVQITGDYVRQGRIDLDGYQLYLSSQGQTTILDNFFRASTLFDPSRPTPVVANGEG